MDQNQKEREELKGTKSREDSSRHVHAHSGQAHALDYEDTTGPRLLMTLGLNLLIPAAQVAGGIYANSMALISDAVHNFSDFTALLIAYVAFRVGKKGASPQNTFGYKRTEILGAVINVALLVAATAFILYGAFERFRRPQPVIGQIVIYLAAVGIAGNGLSAWLLHRDSKHSLNVRGAFLHMVGDMLTSVLVLINGVILVFRPWYWLDPLLSCLIAIFILKNCWSILREATGILMNATPRNLDLEEIRNALQTIPGVWGVHYLHAWNVSSSSIAFSCHVEVTDQPLSHTEPLSEKIRHELFHRFGIDHPILQFETAHCGNGGMLCELSCGKQDG
ncbi:MAG: cation diffusion facilitator family transporter [Deltaproteobacteria bacterium]|nr:cation diffusion facilitator family transporter [Deltaproteobacteria bacterium]